MRYFILTARVHQITVSMIVKAVSIRRAIQIFNAHAGYDVESQLNGTEKITVIETDRVITIDTKDSGSDF